MSKPLCILQAPCFTRSGYGDWALSVAKSLLRYNKYELKIIPTAWGACSKKNMASELQDPEGKQLFDCILNGNLNRQPDIFMQMTIPNEFSAPGKYNIGLTAGIETTVPRPEWLEGLNRMNLNLVTSQHAKDVFVHANYSKKNPNGTIEELKVKNPIEVLFWGADTKIYNKTDQRTESIDNKLNTIPESFAFLFVGQWTATNIKSDRKAIGYLIKTFLEAFRNVPNPPCLILKTSGAQICTMDRYECITRIHDVTKAVENEFPGSTLPAIHLLHGELTDAEMNALYNHEKVKVHVSFTHGEGYGHPLLLSTLSGKPVITPKWSGHLDFLNPKLADFFDGSLVPIPDEAINDWFVKDARWFDVDYAAAGRKMRNYFENYISNPSILDNAEKLRAENMEKFSNQAMDKVLHGYLDKYVPVFAVEEKIILPKLKRMSVPTPGVAPLNFNDGNVTTAPVTLTETK